MEDAETMWSASQESTLRIICGVSNLLSALGCGFIIYCFLFVRQERRSYFQRLVFYLSIVDFFNAIQWLFVLGIIAIDGSDVPFVCQILGPYKMYLYLASFLWTSFISTEMLYRFTHIKTTSFGEVVIPQHSNFKERYYHLIAWLLPLPMAIYPIVDDSMGPAGGYSCWYEEARQGWSFFFLGLVVLTVIYNMVVYAFVTQRYCQMLKMSGIYSTEHGRSFQLERRVPAYILSFVLCWGPALATNVVEAIDDSPSTARFLAECMTAFLLPLTGWLNSIVYGWNKELRAELFIQLRGMCCMCCQRYEEYGEHERQHLKIAHGLRSAYPDDSVQLGDE